MEPRHDISQLRRNTVPAFAISLSRVAVLQKKNSVSLWKQSIILSWQNCHIDQTLLRRNTAQYFEQGGTRPGCAFAKKREGDHASSIMKTKRVANRWIDE
jgi:hypothetical protein